MTLIYRKYVVPIITSLIALLVISFGAPTIFAEPSIMILSSPRSPAIKIIPIKPQAIIPFSGTLGPDECVLYGPIYLSSGENIKITITWTPPYATIIVGLMDVYGNCMYKILNGGYGSVTYQAWSSGNYYVFICNDSPYTIQYSGYMVV